MLEHGPIVCLFTGTGEHIAADNVEVARYGPQDAFGLGNAGNVSALHVRLYTPDDGSRFAGGIQSRRFPQCLVPTTM